MLKRTIRRPLLGLLMALSLASCGTTSSSSTPAAATLPDPATIQHAALCTTARKDFATLGKDFAAATRNNTNAYSAVVADVDTYKTDLTQLRSSGDSGQQAQADQYQGVLDQIKLGAKNASAGDSQGTVAAWTGVAPQIPQIAGLMNALCAGV